MSKVGLRGNNLEIKLGLFFIKPPPKSSPNYKNATLIPKRGNIPTQINLQILKPLFCNFGGSLYNLRQQCHNYAPSIWIYTIMSN